jgi:hypothetical protein
MLVNPYMMQFPHLLAKHAAAIAATLGHGSSNPTQTDLISPLVLQNQLLNNTQLAKGLLPQVSSSNFDLFLNKMNIQQPNVETPAPVASSTQNKSKNSDEFVNCNLCSKSFCSVDFLKLHLINKHGINDQPHKASKQENGDSNEIRYELKLHDSNANTETFCFICEKDFSTKNSLKTHINQKHGVSGENQKTNESDQHQIKSLNDESNQMNAAGKCLDKVVCNICNKQLCNKYFLRTHKAKVHGIKYELVNGLSILSANATSSNESQSNSNNGDDDDDDNIETNVRKRKHEDDIRDDEDIGDGDEDIQDASSQVEDEDEKENKDVKKQAMPTAPLPTSYLKAYCELCNKELCNKYFLKSHMLNAHNINIDNDSDSQNDIEATSTVVSSNRKTVLNKKQLKIKSVALEFSSSTSPKSEIETKYSTNKTDNSVLESTQKIFNELYRSYLPPATPNSPEPQNQTSKFDMQPFLIESKEKKFSENFVPCLVYLPVKNRIQTTIQLQLQLKPLDQTNLTATMTTNEQQINDTKQRSNSSSNSSLIIDTDKQLNDNSMSNDERKNYLPAPISSL